MRNRVSGVLHRLASRLLGLFGYRAKPAAKHDEAHRLEQIQGYLALTSVTPPNYTTGSKSQYGQDLLVTALLGPRDGRGFFVEFGAVDGVHNSNSYYLEYELGWAGIVSEPSRRWHEQLKRNRICHVDTRCVFSESGKRLVFGDTGTWKGGNTLVDYRAADGKKRRFSDRYEVETVSLNDLLRDGQAPGRIDFISVDTEGSEYEILRTFDFSSFNFDLMVIEHNDVEEKRAAIQSLMEKNGYRRLPIDAAVARCDDWYACDEVYDRFIETMCN